MAALIVLFGVFGDRARLTQQPPPSVGAHGRRAGAHRAGAIEAAPVTEHVRTFLP